MSHFLNHVTIAAPRNGTTTHTVDPSSGTVVAGSAFTPTAGRMLVCVAESGAVTSTTPTGWTLGASAIGDSLLYVWYRPTAAGSDTLVTTHNASNYPVVFDLYEFPAGTTWSGAVSAIGVASNGGAGPTLSSLTGTNQVYGVGGQYTDSVHAGPYSGSWSAGTEIVDTSEPSTGGSDYGYTYGATELVDYAGATASAAWTSTNSAFTVERLMWAVKLPPTTTGVLWASGTPATSGTTWANPTYATAANDAARATYTTSTSGAVGYIGCSGYGAQAAIGSEPASVDGVAVTVYGFVNTVARWTSMTVGLFDGSTQVGSSQTMTLTTTTTNSQAFTFTGVTWANLANLTIRVTGTKTGTQSGIMSVDAVKCVVAYTPGSVPSGSGSGTTTFTGSATGTRTPKGSVAGATTLTGVATGKRAPKGSASGSTTFSGTASGDTPSNHGSATGSATFTGTSSGTRTPKGAGTGTATWSGTAVGIRASEGASAGVTTWTGTATGSVPAIGEASGSASGSTIFTGTASGQRISLGSATGSVTLTGAATGKRTPKGSGLGAVTRAGTAVGKRTPKGVGTGALTWTDVASGERTPKGDAIGDTLWTSVAFGAMVLAGSAAGSTTWTGMAGGMTPTTFADTTVTGRLEPRRWEASLDDRDKIGTLAPRRWKGAIT